MKIKKREISSNSILKIKENEFILDGILLKRVKNFNNGCERCFFFNNKSYKCDDFDIFFHCIPYYIFKLDDKL